jgi:hypothetical protein
MQRGFAVVSRSMFFTDYTMFILFDEVFSSASFVRPNIFFVVFPLLKGKTGFGTPRNTQKRVEFAENGNNRWAIYYTGLPDTEVRLQSGTNKFESQKVSNSADWPSFRNIC